MHVKSTVKLNMGKISKLTKASIQALEQTAEAVHTDLVQSQTMPFGEGTMQNTQTFVDYSDSSKGVASIVSSTPYARRLYFHPEYNFNKEENPDAGGKWAEPYMEGGEKQDFAPKAFKQFYKQSGGL